MSVVRSYAVDDGFDSVLNDRHCRRSSHRYYFQITWVSEVVTTNNDDHLSLGPGFSLGDRSRDEGVVSLLPRKKTHGVPI